VEPDLGEAPERLVDRRVRARRHRGDGDLATRALVDRGPAGVGGLLDEPGGELEGEPTRLDLHARTIARQRKTKSAPSSDISTPGIARNAGQNHSCQNASITARSGNERS